MLLLFVPFVFLEGRGDVFVSSYAAYGGSLPSLASCGFVLLVDVAVWQKKSAVHGVDHLPDDSSLNHNRYTPKPKDLNICG